MQIKGAYCYSRASRDIPSCVFSAWSCSLFLVGAFPYLQKPAQCCLSYFCFVLIIEFFHVWNPNIFFKSGLNAWGTQRILTNWEGWGKEQNMRKLGVHSPCFQLTQTQNLSNLWLSFKRMKHNGETLTYILDLLLSASIHAFLLYPSFLSSPVYNGFYVFIY